MPIEILDAMPTNRLADEIEVIDAGSVNRVVSEIRVIDTTGTDRLIYSLSPPLSAASSPSAASGFGLGVSAIATNSVTVTPTGGTGPFAYAWTLLSRDHPTTDPTANSPASATTTFTQTNITMGDFFTADFRCTVMDSLMATATVDVSTSYIEGS